jgi:diaminopimelate decarboxylase
MTLVHALSQQSKRAVKRMVGPLVARSTPSVAAQGPEYWGLKRTPGGLALDGVDLHALGARWGVPVHVVNAARLADNARRFLAVPPGHVTGCEIFYSYKTNPIPGVLTRLHALGIGAEVISHYELWLARQLGVPPERIVFNGPAKSEAAIADAVSAGVNLLNINHREEIQVVGRVAARLGTRVRVGVRVTVGEGWSGQFGVPTAGGQALAAFEEARRSPWLDVVGIHAHRGGMVHTEAELRSFVGGVLAFIDELHGRLNMPLDVVNFGGSLATPTVRGLDARDVRLSRTFQRDLMPADPAASLPIEHYVATIVGLVDQFFRARRRPRPRIFLEPGRSVTGDAQMLLASVITTKIDGDRTFAVLNDGINLADRCRSEYHQLLAVNRASEPAATRHTVVGPICTPGDTLYWAARLPRLTAGDSVLIMDAGAYFVPFSTSFSFPRPPIVVVDEGTASLLRRGERFEDLVAYDEP